MLRFAADLQSAKNKLRDTEWLTVLIKDFQRLTEAVRESKKVFQLCYDWALKNPLAGGEAQNAQLFMLQIRDGSYVPKHPVTRAGKENAQAEQESREKELREKELREKESKAKIDEAPAPEPPRAVIERLGMQLWMTFAEFLNNEEPLIDAFAGDKGKTWTCKIEDASKGKNYYLESVTGAGNWRARKYVFKLAE